MPRGYITRDGFGITAAARRYLAPLIQGEAYPPYRQGLPAYGVAQARPGEEETAAAPRRSAFRRDRASRRVASDALEREAVAPEGAPTGNFLVL